MAQTTAIPADEMIPEPQAETAEASRRPAAAATADTRTWKANARVAVLTAAITVVGGAFAALLVYVFMSIDSRFDSIEARFISIEARFDSIDSRFDSIDARFNTLEARFDALEEGQNEIARTLTALVAELNARAAVDAALAGQLVTPGTNAAEPGSAEP